ncbi:PLP-dependent aminotransferase family protein [Actinomycetospora termitidis]|uniref:PLP-dependent aminotransferase family protein n=1 Tax=Actinomycetospora termitidis TaxID=3053470 RepID=A0ABT7MH60_9PSEU|nr:PLP-dependent aminotransferase family protein [Actinomycetospora sp. Odt1-22]MDL5159776.1 PLP-dependent aminotransferase family protein [Actinomycetospora sp. Odt1-22]
MTIPLATRMHGMTTTAIRRALDRPLRADTISLAGGLPAPETFPVDEYRAALHRRLTDTPVDALAYGSTEGCVELRTAIAELIPRAAAGPDRLLVTNGSQQGLDLVARLLLDPGAGVVVENPSYLGALETFRQYQPRVYPLASDAEGLLPAALSEALRRDRGPGGPNRLRMLYLVPTFANPTGAVTSRRRRLEILEVCERHRLPIVEDDAYGSLRYDDVDGAGDAETFAALDTSGLVIHLGTFSKMLAPGLRLGWIAAAPELVRPLHHLKERSDLASAGAAQLAVADLLREPGFLAGHLERVRDVYRARRDAMVAACATRLGEAACLRVPGGGFFVWLTTGGLDTARLLHEALAPRDGGPVAFVPGAGFHVGDPPRDTVRLSFSACPPERIAEAVRRLGAVLDLARAEGDDAAAVSAA